MILSATELDEMENIANKATPGPWRHHGATYTYCIDNWLALGEPYTIVCHSDSERNKPMFDSCESDICPWCRRERMPRMGIIAHADAAHIAAFNPSTALKLIEEIRTLRKLANKPNTLPAQPTVPDAAPKGDTMKYTLLALALSLTTSVVPKHATEFQRGPGPIIAQCAPDQTCGCLNPRGQPLPPCLVQR